MQLRVMTAWVLIVSAQVCAQDWPQFRGPSGDGRSSATDLPTSWGRVLNPPAWETAIPGSGWSSPIVIGDRIWVTSAEQTALDNTASVDKLDNHKYGAEKFQADARVSLLALELNLRDGAVLRRTKLAMIDDPTPIHVVNSYASPTPVSDGQRIYCHFGSLGTFCVDMKSSSTIWTARLPVEDITGPASSPILCGKHLILVRDGCDQQYIVALDKETGEIVWKRERPKIDVASDKLRRGFSTPLMIDTGERTQIIAPTAHWVVSYDPSSGEEFWRAKVGDGHAVVPAPVYADGHVFVCTGYHKPKMVAIRIDGHGDVTDTHIAWEYEKQVPLIASPVIAGEGIYFVSDNGVASCLEWKTGRMTWQQRIPGDFAASPIYAGGNLYFTNTKGVTTIVSPGREYKELAKNQLFGETFASIAVTEESLLIRNASSLMRIKAIRDQE